MRQRSHPPQPKLVPPVKLFPTLALVAVACATVQGNAQKKPDALARVTSSQLVELTLGGWQVKLLVGKFDKHLHKIKYKGGNVEKIDGLGVWGTDGAMPLERLESVTATFRGRKVLIPAKIYQDCYNPFLLPDSPGDRIQIRVVHREKNAVQVSMRGGSGAGAYYVDWILSERKAAKRRIREWDGDK